MGGRNVFSLEKYDLLNTLIFTPLLLGLSESIVMTNICVFVRMKSKLFKQ